MGDPDKKRKRSKEDQGHKKRKKARASRDEDREPSTASSVVRVRMLLQPRLPPVVATTPGLQVPSSLGFKPFIKKTTRSRDGKKENYEELLLHSSDHPQVDYTGREAGSHHQKHYIGIYDPTTGQMKVVEAKRMEIASSVRAHEASVEDMRPPQQNRNTLEARNELLMEFGNKKARKAVEARTLNAIPKTEKDETGAPKKMDTAAKALLESAKDKVATMATLEDLNRMAEAARPVPRHNPDAEVVQDVYTPEDVIGSTILNAITVKDWSDAMEAGQELQFPFRFVANRLKRIAATGNAKMLRVLRYIYFLLKFYATTRSGKERGTRQILPRDKLRAELAPATETVLDNIRRKFSQDGIMRKNNIDLLITHCCALACVLDGFKTNIRDLEGDLKLERQQMTNYFREIGATVKPITDAGTKKTKTYAILALPLQFPQVIRRKRR